MLKIHYNTKDGDQVAEFDENGNLIKKGEIKATIHIKGKKRSKSYLWKKIS